MRKILAVDLGITSFGYGILEFEESQDNIYRCIDNAVVMRDSLYDEKSGESAQKQHSTHKSLRKLNEKRKKRIKCVARTFDRYGLLPYEKALEFNRKNPIINKWELRAVTAWERPLSVEELFAIFTHMAKHRGYKSIATDDLLYELQMELGLLVIETEGSFKSDERSQVYAALNRLEELKQAYGSETIAQVIHRAVAEGKFRSYRNHDDYEKMIRREDIEEEIEKVLLKQAEFGALPLTNEQIGALIDDLKEFITDQEMPTIDDALFGYCTFYKDEIAAPKYSYLYDLYRLYKKLADLRIDHYEVTQEDREKIVEWVAQKIKAGKNVKTITYKDVREILNLAPDQKIYGQEDEREFKNKKGELKKEPRVFVPFFFLANISKFKKLVASIQKHPDAQTIFKELAEIIQRSKTPQEAYEKVKILLQNNGLDAADAEIVELFKNKKPGTLELSHRYILQALPLFLEGMDEKEIQRQLGFADSEDYSRYPKSLKHLHLGHDNLFEAEENPINNHAVKSLASWALGLIADLSWRYGPFDEIVVESARDTLPEKTRKDIENAMKEREKSLDEIIKKYKKEFPTIDRRLARKIQLWEQQKELDLYTGKTIRLSDLLDGSADIEHIVPRSLGGLSTAYNTIVALKDANAQKGNRLPGDWLAGDEGYRNRVKMLRNDLGWKKCKNLLATNLDEVFIENMHSKGIRATSYLEALVVQVLKRYYPFPDPDARRNGHTVRMIPGRVTSKVRSLLGVKSKSRDTNFHHAEDALILATITRGWQNRLHRMLRDKYGKSEEELQAIWKKHTPHIEGITIADYVKEAFERFMSKGEESLFYRDMFGGIRSVSYWVNKKPLSASSHKDTVYSARHEVPTLRKNILEAFSALDVLKKRNDDDWSAEEFMKLYDKEIRQKLWLHRIGNLNDESYRAVEARAAKIAETITRYQLMDAHSDKAVDEEYQKELKALLNMSIEAGGKQIRKMRFIINKNTMLINRGLVETDKNMLGIYLSKGTKGKLAIQRMDVNNAHELMQRKDGMLCFLNEMLFFFNRKKLIHYGCLRSYSVNNQGSKYVKLFNPRYPSNPKAQPKKFSKGSSTRDVSVGSTTGIIKAHLDLDGHVKSYEVFGSVTPEQLQWFKQESGYGGVENDPNH